MERTENDTIQIKVRMKERTRAQLEEAARDHDWPLNREIAARLEASLHVERSAPTRETGMLLSSIGTIAGLIEAQGGKRWHEDPETFYALRAAILTILDTNNPDGERPSSAETDAARAEMERAAAAMEAFEADHPRLRLLKQRSDSEVDTLTPDDFESEEVHAEAMRLAEQAAEAAARTLVIQRAYHEAVHARTDRELTGFSQAWAATAGYAHLLRFTTPAKTERG